MIKLSQKGIAHLGLVVLVAALLIVGATGFFVYQNNKNTNNEKDPSGVIDQSKTEDSKQDIVLNLSNTYKDNIGKFSIKYPDTWTLEKDLNNTSNESSFATLSNNKGTSIVISSGLGGYGFEANCTVDEKTGTVTWSELKKDSKDPCSYALYYKSKKIGTVELENGTVEDLYVSEKSYGDDRERSYGLAVRFGVGEKKSGTKYYGVDVLNGFIPSKYNSRVLVAVEQVGKNQDFFNEPGIKEASTILETMKFD